MGAQNTANPNASKKEQSFVTYAANGCFEATLTDAVVCMKVGYAK
ncbi:hypothetical protein SAMN04488117_103335 [Celeribacter baekdonensis]|uniref:Uncharacterized protein n=1 Tax=Celeribacter baekdonensis TaxID=875171 RepID=A0A1G7K5C5_9RHOB|nr:hypothetical protein SAMN04488117_103335 [Celeribacter baekdonensis]